MESKTVKQSLLFLVVGLVSGIAGALTVDGIRSVQAPVLSRVESSKPDEPRPFRRPPGWDAVLSSSSAPVPKAKEQPEHLSGRDQDREGDRDHQRALIYQQELDLHDRQLAGHADETLDRTWSETEVSTIQGAFRTSQDSDRLREVDCRNTTCTATLGFDSPDEALRYVSDTRRHLAVPGCNGYNIIPRPPQGQGPYDLTVYYTCR